MDAIQPTPDPVVPSPSISYLTSQQQTQLAAFRTSLEKAGLYKPGNPPSHDDATLIRFLKARRFDAAKAQQQFAATEAWRVEHKVDELYATFPGEELERAKIFYPRWTGRRDKEGVPVYVYRLASLTTDLQKELHAVPVERRYQRIVALWEFMRLFALPLCSSLPHPPPPPIGLSPKVGFRPPPAEIDATAAAGVSATPITSTFSIIDLADVSLGTMWGLRHHLQQASELATAHYPETLHRVAVVNAPSFFGTVWGWIKTWFDEGTRNKVHVLDSNPGPTLLTMIDAANLPRAYGGELAFTFEDNPVLDAATKDALGRDTVPIGPVVYRDGKWARPEGWQEEVRTEDTNSAESAPTKTKPVRKSRFLVF